MTDASTAPASQILEAILQRPDAKIALIRLAEGLKGALRNHEVMAPWKEQHGRFTRCFWSFSGKNPWECVEVEELTKGGPRPWIVTFWVIDVRPSSQFATPEEAQAWADEQLIAAGYTLLPQGYNQGATP